MNIYEKMFTDFNSQARTISDTIIDFLSTKKGKKAIDTVKYYEDRLNSLNEYLKENEGITDLCEINRSVIDRYMNSKKENNPKISNQTLNNNLRAIRTFINYCINEGYIRHFKIEMYKSTNIPKKPYTNIVLLKWFPFLWRILWQIPPTGAG